MATVAPRYAGVKPCVRAVPRLGRYAAANRCYTACMIKASVSQTRTGLSGLLAEVRQGETVIIMQRGRPVAKITRYDPAGLTDDLAAAELVRSGLSDPPEAPLDVDRFLATPRPRLANGLSVSELIVAERRAGR